MFWGKRREASFANNPDFAPLGNPTGEAPQGVVPLASSSLTKIYLQTVSFHSSQPLCHFIPLTSFHFHLWVQSPHPTITPLALFPFTSSLMPQDSHAIGLFFFFFSHSTPKTPKKCRPSNTQPPESLPQVPNTLLPPFAIARKFILLLLGSPKPYYSSLMAPTVGKLVRPSGKI